MFWMHFSNICKTWVCSEILKQNLKINKVETTLSEVVGNYGSIVQVQMPQSNMWINDVPTDEQTDSCFYIVYWKTTFVIYLFICQFQKNTFLASQRHSIWQPHFYYFNIFPIRPIISREREREREKNTKLFIYYLFCLIISLYIYFY